MELNLTAGIQTLRIQTPTTEHKRGIALRWFELKVKEQQKQLGSRHALPETQGIELSQ